MKKFVISSLTLLYLFTSAAAEYEKKPFIMGEKVRIHSDILKEDRDLLIYLPQEYEESQDKYSVLYLLDGEWHFIHASGIVQFLTRPRIERIPKMMVVAVINTYRGRDFSPSTWPGYRSYTGGADNFLRFFKEELVPFVKANYRTRPTKILAGHSLAGTFTLYAFLSQPEIFDAYVSLSPCLFWHERLMLKKSEAFLEKYENLAKTLFIAHEYTEGEPATTMHEFVESFNSLAPHGLRWKSILMDQETHFSLVHKALYNGLEYIFSNKRSVNQNR